MTPVRGPGDCSEGNFWGLGSVVLGLVLFGAKNLSPNLCRSTCFSSEVPGLRAQSASCCKGNCMAIQTTKPASSLRQCWKEQDGKCPVSSNHLGASYFLLSWIAQNCLLQSLSRGPNSSPKNILGGLKNVTKFLRDRRKSKKDAKSGARKTFSGRTKSSPKNEHFAPEAKGQSSRKRRSRRTGRQQRCHGNVQHLSTFFDVL